MLIVLEQFCLEVVVCFVQTNANVSLIKSTEAAQRGTALLLNNPHTSFFP